MPILPGRIEVAYNGNYAQNLVWNQIKLDEFVKTSDLRTAITIKDSDQRQPNAVSVGTGPTKTLAKFGDPRNLFRTKNSTPEMNVNFNPITAEATVALNYHAITEELRKSGDNAVGERFAKRTQTLVSQGLKTVHNAEKALQLANSSKAGGIRALVFSSSLLPLATWIYFIGDAFHSILSSISGNPDYQSINEKTFLDLALFTASGFLQIAVQNITRTRKRNSPRQQVSPYFQSISDILIPPKHLKNTYAGNTFLDYNRNSLVSYKP